MSEYQVGFKGVILDADKDHIYCDGLEVMEAYFKGHCVWKSNDENNWEQIRTVARDIIFFFEDNYYTIAEASNWYENIFKIHKFKYLYNGKNINILKDTKQNIFWYNNYGYYPDAPSPYDNVTITFDYLRKNIILIYVSSASHKLVFRTFNLRDKKLSEPIEINSNVTITLLANINLHYSSNFIIQYVNNNYKIKNTKPLYYLRKNELIYNVYVKEDTNGTYEHTVADFSVVKEASIVSTMHTRTKEPYSLTYRVDSVYYHVHYHTYYRMHLKYRIIKYKNISSPRCLMTGLITSQNNRINENSIYFISKDYLYGVQFALEYCEYCDVKLDDDGPGYSNNNFGVWKEENKNKFNCIINTLQGSFKTPILKFGELNELPVYSSILEFTDIPSFTTIYYDIDKKSYAIDISSNINLVFRNFWGNETFPDYVTLAHSSNICKSLKTEYQILKYNNLENKIEYIDKVLNTPYSYLFTYNSGSAVRTNPASAIHYNNKAYLFIDTAELKEPTNITNNSFTDLFIQSFDYRDIKYGLYAFDVNTFDNEHLADFNSPFEKYRNYFDFYTFFISNGYILSVCYYKNYYLCIFIYDINNSKKIKDEEINCNADIADYFNKSTSRTHILNGSYDKKNDMLYTKDHIIDFKKSELITIGDYYY